MGFDPPSWEAAVAATPGTRPLRARHCAIWLATRSQCLGGGTMPGGLVHQAGVGAGAALTVAPTNRETTIPPHLFRLILLRRLRQALSLSVRNCRCGRPLDFCGHHRAACARAGVLGRRGFALESVAARICREAGGRVRTNMLVRDMDLDVPIADARRLEAVVDGLPLGRSPTCSGHDAGLCLACRRSAATRLSMTVSP